AGAASANPFRAKANAALRESSSELAGRFSVALSTGNSAFCVAVALAACLAQPALALDPRYPDWPCQQLKVPGISIASVWSGPSIEGIAATTPEDARQEELATRLPARRTPIEEARKLIADYVTGTGEEKQQKAKAL